ncbi:MAG: 6-phosphofructokinase [Clostridia bacterium]|nr:6-phosphofructokinase [Clostridia bacterium]
MKKIAVLTSGGDAPGMNAAIRAVVRSGIAAGMEVIGVRRGYDGLLDNDVFEMDLRSVSNILQRGGTFLSTARSPRFNTPAGVKQAARNCRQMGIEGLVVIGGDGSFKGARDLCAEGISCIGLPGTIDNDISCTDYTIGYDTALNTAIEMVDRIRDTMQSHDRCCIVEVMGHHKGDLALNAGLAVGAVAILVPEEQYNIDRDIIAPIKRSQKLGKHHFIIVVSELMVDIEALCKEVERKIGVKTRSCVLGHVQRGGSPTARDRVLASEMGHYAVQLLVQGKSCRVVGIKNDQLVNYDITEGLAIPKEFNHELLRVAREISI